MNGNVGRLGRTVELAVVLLAVALAVGIAVFFHVQDEPPPEKGGFFVAEPGKRAAKSPARRPAPRSDTKPLSLREQGQKALRDGDAGGAESLFRQRLQELKRDNAKPALLVGAFNDLAAALVALGRPDEAEVHYWQAMDVAREAGGDGLGEATRTIDALGAMYRAQNRKEEIADLYQSGLAVLKAAGAGEEERQALKNRLLQSLQPSSGEQPKLLAEPQGTFQAGWRSSGDRPQLCGENFPVPDGAACVPVFAAEGFEPVGMRVAASWKQASAKLSRNKPRSILREPPYRGRSRLYGHVRLGTFDNNAYAFAFDLVDGPNPDLYFDFNNNGDLSDDGPPVENQGSGRFAAEIRLPAREIIKELATDQEIAIWFFTNDSLWKRGYATHYTRTQLAGRVAINGKSFMAYLTDRDINDLDLTNNGIYLDLDGSGKVDWKTEYVAPGQVARINGKDYVFDVGW